MKVYEQIIRLAPPYSYASPHPILFGEGWVRAMAHAGTPQGEEESHGSLPKGAFAGVGCFTKSAGLGGANAVERLQC